MSDSVAWCILAGFKITSVFSRIIYHIIESVCEFAASILQGYVYGEQKGVTFKVTNKSHQRKRKSAIGRTEGETRNAEEPETRDFVRKSNEPVMTEDMLTVSGQRFCFRGADKIIECNLRDAKKITISFDFYPFQNRSTVEILDSSKHGAPDHVVEENGDTSVEPKLSTDSKQANGHLHESDVEDRSRLKCTDKSKLSEKTIFKSDCSMHTPKDDPKLSSDNENGLIINGAQCKVDGAFHSDAEKQTTSRVDVKEVPETFSQKQQDTSVDTKKNVSIPSEKNLVLEAPSRNEIIPSITIDKKPGSDSAADKKHGSDSSADKKALIASTVDKIKDVLKSRVDEKRHVTVCPIDECKKPMTQSTTNREPVAAFPVDTKGDLSECHADKNSETGPTSDKRSTPTAATDKRYVLVAAANTGSVLAPAADKKTASKSVSELVPDKKPIPPSTATKGSAPLVSTDTKPAVEAVAAKKNVPLPASGAVSCKNPVPESAATKGPVPASATKSPVPEDSVKKDTVHVVAESNMPAPEAVTNKKHSVHITDKKPLPASAATKVPLSGESTNKGHVPLSYANNRPAPETSHDKMPASVRNTDKKLSSVSPNDEKPVPVPNRKPDLASATDEKPVSASTATKGPDPKAVADQKHVKASEADRKTTQVPTANKNLDPVSLANKKPGMAPAAYKKPVQVPAAGSAPVPVTDKGSASATSADKRCASAPASDFRPVSVPHATKPRSLSLLRSLSLPWSLSLPHASEPVSAATADKVTFAASVAVKQPASASTNDKKPIPETSDKRPMPSSTEKGPLPAAITDKKPALATTTDKKPVLETSTDKRHVPSSAEKGPLPTAITDKKPAPECITDKKPVPEDKRPVPSSATEKEPAPGRHRGRDSADLVSVVSASDEGDKTISQMPERSDVIQNESEVIKRSTDALPVSQVRAEAENIATEEISNASKDSDAVASDCKAVPEINEGGPVDPSLMKKLDVQGNAVDTDGSVEMFRENFYEMLEKGPPIVIAPDILLIPSLSPYHTSNNENAQNIGMNSKYIQDGWDCTDKYFYDYIIEREKKMEQFDPSALNLFSTDKDMSEEDGGNESKGEESRDELLTLHGEIIDRYNPMTELPKYYDLISDADTKYILVKRKIQSYTKREVIDNLGKAAGASSTDNPNGSSAVGQRNAAERSGRESGSASGSKDVRARGESSNEHPKHRKNYAEMGARPKTYSRAGHK